ncbi:hypothetical protein D3C83_93280 [compost metagenome]
MRSAATTRMKSCNGRRCSMFLMAVSKSTPSRCSRSISSNSWESGGFCSLIMDSMPTVRLAPARMLPEIISSASGNWRSKSFSRFLRR